MLQQTRVAAVLPYYERFLERFPTVEALAEAPEEVLLTLWAGLGYYRRARLLGQAARQIVGRGAFPSDYAGIRALAGVGDYTAAAIASIAFGRPHAVLDGNTLRVLSRLFCDAGDIRAAATRRRLAAYAAALLAPRRPGECNQAMMELGATLCLPKNPRCSVCPVKAACEARKQGTQNELPVKLGREEIRREERILLLIERGSRLLMWRRPANTAKLAGFWELPEPAQAPGAERLEECGWFRHGITNHSYRIAVVRARLRRQPPGLTWVDQDQLDRMPVSTTARKALAVATSQGGGRRDRGALS